MTKERKTFAEYIKDFFPDIKLQKLSINAGFSCPTRDGAKSTGGCTYCNNKSFSPAFSLRKQDIISQIEYGIDFFKDKYPDMRYLAYFQAYTNTYAELSLLKKMYEEALSHPKVLGLVIGTRPDCMPVELLDYLEELNQKTFLMLEYGVESTIDRSLELVQRGHDYACSRDMILETHRRGIKVGAHLILGLPGESREDILSHADRLNELPLDTLKLHQLQIIKGTIMAKDYLANPDKYHLFELDEYIDICSDFSLRLRDDIVIERYGASAPAGMVIAPSWGIKNHVLTDKILKRIKIKLDTNQNI